MKKHKVPFWWGLKTLLSLGLIFYGVFVALFFPLLPLNFRLPLYIGQIVVLAGAFVYIWHYALLKTQAKSLAMPDSLVCRGGMYFCIRHPMYLGDMFILIGIFCFVFDYVSLICCTVGIVVIFVQCQVEDQEMSLRFPEKHSLWKSKTKMLFPWIL